MKKILILIAAIMTVAPPAAADEPVDAEALASFERADIAAIKATRMVHPITEVKAPNDKQEALYVAQKIIEAAEQNKHAITTAIQRSRLALKQLIPLLHRASEAGSRLPANEEPATLRADAIVAMRKLLNEEGSGRLFTPEQVRNYNLLHGFLDATAVYSDRSNHAGIDKLLVKFQNLSARIEILKAMRNFHRARLAYIKNRLRAFAYMERMPAFDNLSARHAKNFDDKLLRQIRPAQLKKGYQQVELNLRPIGEGANP
ncbi:MAG: hypothetical protein D6704_04750 [Nitrospirae bacterium]|nr:MAG: hypothetical protein D6704_04750 [Nitrospirota bacterium]